MVREVPFTSLEESFEIFTLTLIEVMNQVTRSGVCFCDEDEQDGCKDSHDGEGCTRPHLDLLALKQEIAIN